MELTDRLSTLPHQSKLKVMERVFQKMSLAFGSQFSEKWKGFQIEDIAEDWIEDLNQFSLGAINHGIEKSRALSFPPNLGQFVAFCVEFVPPESNVLKISRKFTPEELAKNRERLKAISEMLASNKSMNG